MEPNSKILVTGATGFIGTQLVQALIKRGHAVRALSRRADPKPPPGLGDGDAGPLNHPRVELMRGDIADRPSLARAIEGCQYVFHLAAYAKNWAPQRRTYYETNLAGARNVFDAARAARVRRIVWTSTIVTLGPTPPDVVGDEAMPRITEQCLTDYEDSKLAAERDALSYVAEGLPLVIVNPARVYGPGHLTEGNALARLIDDYDRGRVPVLLNRGVNVGNYVLVDDVVEGHILAMEKGRVGERYILGGENASLREFFRAIDRASSKRHMQIPIMRFGPLLVAWCQQRRAERRGIYPRITPGWVRTFSVDWAFSTAKAQRELGYRPTPLDEGLRRTYEWLLRVREETS